MINCNDAKKIYMYGSKSSKGSFSVTSNVYILEENETFDQTLIIALIFSTTWKLIKVKITC